MQTQSDRDYDRLRRIAWIYLGLLFGLVIAFGILHLFFAELKVGRVWWFNLDKERNIPTWFSGVLLLLLGFVSCVAYYWEKSRNAIDHAYFRLPILWLGIACSAFFMSLDEMTILHENLFWREVRLTTTTMDRSWQYLTQWQILFAPAIVIVLGYMTVFFLNRFRLSQSAMRNAFAGIGCWLTALFLESIREVFKDIGQSAYEIAMIVEELLEMTGTLLLLAAIIFYVIDISCDFSAIRRKRLQQGARLLTKRAAIVLTFCIAVLVLAGGTTYLFAQRLAAKEAPVPRLIKKVLRSTANKPNSSRESAPANAFWLTDLGKGGVFSEPDKKALVSYITTSLFDGTASQETFPNAILQDNAPRMVFISLSDGNSPARVVMGQGGNVMQAVEQGLSRMRSVMASDYQPKWLKFDIVERIETLPNVAAGQPLPMDRSLRGIGFDRSSGIVLLPEEILANRLVSNSSGLRRDRINRYLKAQPLLVSRQLNFTKGTRLSINSLTTSSFFSDATQIFPLYRGHRSFDRQSPATLLASARLGGDYLKSAVGPNGKFVYAYRPKQDKISENYNILRHAGAVYAMLELYHITGDTTLIEAARRAIDYLLSFVKDCQFATVTDLACVVEKDHVKLGGNALAVIALAEYTKVTQDRQYIPTLRRLARWIQSVQAENGEFSIHKQQYASGVVEKFRSQYYPGEAVLALTRMFAVDGSASWLDTAERNVQFLIDHRDRDIPEEQLIHDHWLLYGLNELHRYRPKQLYLDHSLRVSKAIMKKQNLQPDYPDWLGSFYRPPRSTPTATRMEGLCAAYQIIQDFGDSKDALSILDAVHRGIRFQLQTQFQPESVLYLKDPNRSLGGFHRSLTNFEIRIDYVQHNISSLLALYRILSDGKSHHTGPMAE